tara:strand:+ start:507 stop:800 length:294 start_codon:yes stop_codon:yes gene_type:complete
VERWDPVGDVTEPWGRLEGIIFIEKRSYHALTELLRIKYDHVRLRIYVKTVSFDEYIGASGKGGLGNTNSFVRLEGLGLGLLKVLLLVANSLEEVGG